MRRVIGSAVVVCIAMAMVTVGRAEDSTVGKRPYALEISRIPPRGEGPGLRFNTQRLFYVYTDQRSGANHFAPSGWMGDYKDLGLNTDYRVNPADGKTCIEVSYTPQQGQAAGWAGMYWQEPGGNWGQLAKGYNLGQMTRVTFWARGAKGGEIISEFKVGGIAGDHPDSGSASIGPITLNREWTEYAIDLAGVDLSKISGGFAWSANRIENPDGAIFYLDEIRYERTETVGVSVALGRPGVGSNQ